MASFRPCLALVPKTIGRRQFSLSQRKRLQDNWDQEALPGSNVPFNSKKISSQN
jgi:hypothetical protein